MRHTLARWGTRLAVVALVLLTAGQGANARPQRRDILLLQTADAKVRVRHQATLELSRILTRDDVPWLVRVLNRHQDRRIRLAAVTLLDHFQDRYAIGILSKTLREPPPAESDSGLQHKLARLIRGRAARALGRIDRSRPINPRVEASLQYKLIQAMTQDPTAWVRMHAVHALSEILGAAAIPHLERAKSQRGTLTDSQGRKDLKAFADQSVARIRAHEDRLPGRHLSKIAHLLPGRTTTGWLDGSKYLVYTPPTYTPSDKGRGLSDTPVLASIHGSVGEAGPYLDMCIPDAMKYRHVVIAPHFDFGAFPVYGDVVYQFGYKRSDEHLLDLIQRLARQLDLPVERFNIFGHSQGGQFVHRFVLAHPDRIRRAAACASGVYVDLEMDDAFPYGNLPNPLASDLRIDIGRLVTSQLVIVVGSEDEASGDNPERRLEAADEFARQVQAYAARNRLRSMVSTRVAQGAEHRGTHNYPTASENLFRRMWILKHDFPRQ